MRAFAILAATLSLGTAAFPAAAEVVAGKMIYSADGKKIGAVYRVAKDGSPQVIINGKLFTIPAASVKTADGKIETSISKKDLVSGGSAG